MRKRENRPEKIYQILQSRIKRSYKVHIGKKETWLLGRKKLTIYYIYLDSFIHDPVIFNKWK